MEDRNKLDWLTATPIAHRALHDGNKRCFENSLQAIQAAIDAGYSIEVDIQFANDGVPVVFHDESLNRLTKHEADTRSLNSVELGRIKLGGTADYIPTLKELLDLVDGKVGLVIELKGIEGKDAGFMKSVLDVVSSYKGKIALMSFDHWLLEDLRKLNCPYPVGLVAYGKDNEQFEIHKMAVGRHKVDFVSYNISEIPNAFTDQIKKDDIPLICWTVRDQKTADKAYQFCGQITFEGFIPA